MNREHRAFRATEIRATPDSRTFEAVVVNYGVLDDYDTIFDAGCFAASLEERMPRITWAHDWSEPLGRYVDYRDTDKSLTLIGEFDDFTAVPTARRAHAQLLSGTIDQFSVGFHRIDSYEDDDNHTHFRKAGLDEAALVLVGAVPGTKLLSVRSGQGGRREVPEALVIDLAKKVTAGELTQQEAAVAIDLAAGIPTVGEPAPEPKAVELSAEDVATLAAADEALEALGLG